MFTRFLKKESPFKKIFHRSFIRQLVVIEHCGGGAATFLNSAQLPIAYFLESPTDLLVIRYY